MSPPGGAVPGSVPAEWHAPRNAKGSTVPQDSDQTAISSSERSTTPTKRLWRKLKKKNRPQALTAAGADADELSEHRRFSSMRLPEVDVRTERLSITPLWLFASQQAQAEDESQPQAKPLTPLRPAERVTRHPFISPAYTGSPPLSSSPEPEARFTTPSRHAYRSQQAYSPDLFVHSDAHVPAAVGEDEADVLPPMLTQHKAASPRLRNYHLPSSQAYGQGVQVRPSPQRRPTLTSVRSASGSEADQQERVLAPNQVKQYHVQQFTPPLRSSSYGSLDNTFQDTSSIISGPTSSSMDLSQGYFESAVSRSQETAPTSRSEHSFKGHSHTGSAPWFSDSLDGSDQDEGQWDEHIASYASDQEAVDEEADEDDEEDIDPAARQLGQLSLQQQAHSHAERSNARHEALLARKYSIERASRTRVTRKPSVKTRLPTAREVDDEQ